MFATHALFKHTKCSSSNKQDRNTFRSIGRAKGEKFRKILKNSEKFRKNPKKSGNFQKLFSKYKSTKERPFVDSFSDFLNAVHSCVHSCGIERRSGNRSPIENAVLNAVHLNAVRSTYGLDGYF